MDAGGAGPARRVAPVVLAVLLVGLLAVLVALPPLAGEGPVDDAGGGAATDLDQATDDSAPHVTSLTIEREVEYGLDLVVEHDEAVDELWLFDLLRPVTPVHLARGVGAGWAVGDDHGVVNVAVERDRTVEGQLVLALRGTHTNHGWAVLDPTGATTTAWPDGHPEAGTDPLVALAPGRVTDLAVRQALHGGVELVVATDGRLDELWLFTPADPMSLLRLSRHGDTLDLPVGYHHLSTHETRGPWIPERLRLGFGHDVARWVAVDEDAATGGLVLTIAGRSTEDGWAVVDGAGNRTPAVGHLGASGLVDLPPGQVAAALAADLAAVQRGVVRFPPQAYGDSGTQGLVLGLAAEQLVPGTRVVRRSPADESDAAGVELVVTADWPYYIEREAGGRARGRARG